MNKKKRNKITEKKLIKAANRESTKMRMNADRFEDIIKDFILGYESIIDGDADNGVRLSEQAIKKYKRIKGE